MLEGARHYILCSTDSVIPSCRQKEPLCFVPELAFYLHKSRCPRLRNIVSGPVHGLVLLSSILGRSDVRRKRQSRLYRRFDWAACGVDEKPVEAQAWRRCSNAVPCLISPPPRFLSESLIFVTSSAYCEVGAVAGRSGYVRHVGTIELYSYNDNVQSALVCRDDKGRMFLKVVSWDVNCCSSNRE